MYGMMDMVRKATARVQQSHGTETGIAHPSFRIRYLCGFGTCQLEELGIACSTEYLYLLAIMKVCHERQFSCTFDTSAPPQTPGVASLRVLEFSERDGGPV